MKRKSLTLREKRTLWERQNGKCALPGCALPLVAGRFEDDHALALIDGGTNDLDNRRLICTAHHRLKSAQEHKANSKAKRIRFGKAKKYPPMAGSRASKFKRHMDGRVSYR